MGAIAAILVACMVDGLNAKRYVEVPISWTRNMVESWFHIFGSSEPDALVIIVDPPAVLASVTRTMRLWKSGSSTTRFAPVRLPHEVSCPATHVFGPTC